MKGNSISLPEDAPKIGEIYQHYKGDYYKVIGLALHSNDEEWMVVYAPVYENSAADLFTRPLREWNEKIIWEGKETIRFQKIERIS